MKQRKSYLIGFEHGNRYGGTINYSPGARAGAARAEYDSGFDAGQAFFNYRTYPERAYMAWLNRPRAIRGAAPYTPPQVDARKAMRYEDAHMVYCDGQ